MVKQCAHKIIGADDGISTGTNSIFDLADGQDFSIDWYVLIISANGNGCQDGIYIGFTLIFNNIGTYKDRICFVNVCLDQYGILARVTMDEMNRKMPIWELIECAVNHYNFLFDIFFRNHIYQLSCPFIPADDNDMIIAMKRNLSL